MTPRELVTAAQNGDHDAFAQLWRLYRDNIMALVYRRTSDRWLAEDITSETFLRAWRRLPSFTWQRSGFSGWLATIAANLVADHYKSAHRRHATSHPLDNADEWPVPSTDRWQDPQQVLEHADLAEALRQAIAKLTPEQQTVMELRFRAELCHAEAGSLMGRNAAAVKQMQFRAVQMLRANPDLAAAVAA